MTPEHVEVCCDAMRESGVPDEFISEIVDALWARDRGNMVRLCASRTIPGEADASMVDMIGREVLRNLASGILDRGLVRRSLDVVNGDVILKLTIDVIPPRPRYPHG